MEKTPFIEIDKRGILTVIISEGIMIMVILKSNLNSHN